MAIAKLLTELSAHLAQRGASNPVRWLSSERSIELATRSRIIQQWDRARAQADAAGEPMTDERDIALLKRCAAESQSWAASARSVDALVAFHAAKIGLAAMASSRRESLSEGAYALFAKDGTMVAQAPCVSGALNCIFAIRDSERIGAACVSSRSEQKRPRAPRL